MFEDEGEPGVGLCKTSIPLHNFSLRVHFIKITITKLRQSEYDRFERHTFIARTCVLFLITNIKICIISFFLRCKLLNVTISHLLEY